jgi:hypothetical protein
MEQGQTRGEISEPGSQSYVTNSPPTCYGLPGCSGASRLLFDNSEQCAAESAGNLDVSMTLQPDFDHEKNLENHVADTGKSHCNECEKNNSRYENSGACTLTSYASGGCDCSSELVAMMVLQRHHTAGNCTICSRNTEFRSIDGVLCLNTGEVLDQVTENSHGVDEIAVGDLETSSVDSERTCNSPPGDSKLDQGSAFAFNDLPPPIILKIFGYLTRFELLRKVALVCKYWNHLSQDPELWRTLDFRGQFKLTNRILERLTSYSDHVTSIDLSDSKLISSDGVEALTKRCHALQVLKLNRCYSLMGPAFRSIGENCPFLLKLFFDICYSLTDEDLRSVSI